MGQYACSPWKKWPGLLKYVISSDIRFSNVNKKEYDGLAELWFKDENTLNMALESPERKISREDFQKFVKEVEIIVTKEHIILDKIKNLWFLNLEFNKKIRILFKKDRYLKSMLKW